MRHLIFCGNGCFFLCLEVRKSNIFEAVKESVTTRQAAEYYGVQVGRNGMAYCPFHDDKHPSMKIDHRFHCFGCQADGDVIDFTARLFSLSSKEAALKLAEDFSVHYDAKGHDPPRRKPVKRKISEELRYRQAEQGVRVLRTGERSLTLLFDEPQRAVTPGQYAVLYDETQCLGGGVITGAFRK